MGILGERISGFVEDRITAWRERLRGWAVATIGLGLEALLHAVGKSVAPLLKPLIERIEETGEIPEELQALFKEMKGPTGQGPAAIAMTAGTMVMGGAIGKITDAMFLPLAYKMNTRNPKQIVSAELLIMLKRRGYIDEAYFRKHMKMLGWGDEWTDHFQEVMQAYPALGDVIRFYAREAFEPDMIERYGLKDELPPYAGTLFEKLGVPKEIADLYWISHWEHASWMQVVEMLRRGQLTEAEVREWFRVVEIPPYWRDKLIAISYEVPTRVDVRRWWDLRTIDENRLREIYAWRGYHGKDLDDYVLWTKVYTAWPDLIARWKNGWITLDDVRDELVGLGMPAARVEELIETKIKANEPERTANERDLTKTDIVKGVKQGRITRSEGVELLMDLGYDEDEAVFLLEINIPPDQEDQAVTERQLTKADIMKGLKAEILTEDEARDKLLELRYSPTDVDLLLTIYRATAKPPVEPRAKEASKADIVAAVTKGLLAPEEAYLMLQDIDYSPEAAQFILSVRAETSPFSPINFQEFKDLTQKWRKGAGMEAKPVSEELKLAAGELVKVNKEVEDLSDSVAEEEAKLIPGEELPAEATKRLKELRVALHRAEAKLAQAQASYDKLMAEYKHKAES